MDQCVDRAFFVYKQIAIKAWVLRNLTFLCSHE
jgi:hypothetical protein